MYTLAQKLLTPVPNESWPKMTSSLAPHATLNEYTPTAHAGLHYCGWKLRFGCRSGRTAAAIRAAADEVQLGGEIIELIPHAACLCHSQALPEHAGGMLL